MRYCLCMPRHEPGERFNILDEPVAYDTKVLTKLRTCWKGLYRVTVCLYEETGQSRKKRESKIRTFFLDGADANTAPDPATDPNENEHEVIQWIYSAAIEKAEEEERKIHCRARFYYRDEEGKNRESSAEFDVYPEENEADDEEEEDDEEEGDEDEDDRVRVRGRRYPLPLAPQKTNQLIKVIEDRHKITLEHDSAREARMEKRFDEERQRLRAREDELDKQARAREDEARKREESRFDKVIALLEKRMDQVDDRDQRAFQLLADINTGQRAENKELANKYGELSRVLVGGRQSQMEGTTQAWNALSEGIRMQVSGVQRELELERQRNAEKIEQAKSDSRSKLMQALLLPILGNLPQTIAGLAHIVKALRDDTTPSPTFTPAPATNPPPPQEPFYKTQTTGVGNPWSNGAYAPSPTATVTPTPFAGIHRLCEKVNSTLTAEQRTRLRERLGADLHEAFTRWMAASNETECVASMATFQMAACEKFPSRKIIDGEKETELAAGQEAYAYLDEVLNDDQVTAIETITAKLQGN